MNGAAKIKVAHVITRMIVGGAQENTLDTALGLHGKGSYAVTLVTGPELGPEGDLLALHSSMDFPIVVIRSLRRNIHPIHDILAFFALVQLFKRQKFDIVHTHSSKAGILGRWAARIAGVPLVIHTIHGLAIGPYQGKARNGIFRGLERGAARCTDVLVCVSESLAREVKNLGLRPRRGTVVIQSGFDWKMFEEAAGHRDEIRQQMGLDLQCPVIVKVARFFPLKGYHEFFEMIGPLLEATPSLQCVLVGDGPDRNNFEQMTARRGWNGRITFTGLVPPRRVAEVVAASDLLVHTSLREGLPRVIPQAFAAGKPVVVYNIDGAADLVKDGQTGFLIEPLNVQAMREAIQRLLEDSVLRDRMGRAGHDLAKNNYSLEHMVDAVDKLYRMNLPC